MKRDETHDGRKGREENGSKLRRKKKEKEKKEE